MRESHFLKPLLTLLLKLLFRVEVVGVEHMRAAGSRVLVIANHMSFLDPLLLAVFVPYVPGFAISVYQAQKWYFRWLDKLVTLYRLDPVKPLSMKRLIQDLRAGSEGATVVLFPEGRISTSGGIMKVYDGAGLILEKTGATVVTARIEGTEYSKCSRLRHKLRLRWLPKIRITFMPPVAFKQGKEVPHHMIYDMMCESAFRAADTRQTLLSAVLNAYELHGGKHVVASDIARIDMNYRQLFTRAFVLRNKLNGILNPQKHAQDYNHYVGVMLPNALGAMVTFLSLHMLGKIPCMLNYSAGPSSIAHACKIAKVKTILTSRAFIEKGKLEALIDGLKEHYAIVYLEDIKPTVTAKDKITGLFHALYPHDALKSMLLIVQPDDPAVIIYTSGSEGTPKGVVLSHRNILSNIEQFFSRLDITTADKLFNAMPVFHSFGLTVGLLMPMARGINTFLYPSPLHYRIIPDLIYDTDSTVMLGTDTFYNGYARYAHPYDFWNIRLAVAGAEKLKPTTQLLYSDTFRVNIIEGYGVSEASPVVAVNTPMEHKTGSVGRILPSIKYQLKPVEGMEKGGRLFIQGPNIMLGYLKADQPGVIQKQGDWYDTGDIVDIDAEGFVFILGRAKRFAKIAGEMVSLQIAEDLAANIAPGTTHAAISIPDERKGEQILLFTESSSLTKDQLLLEAKKSGVAEICLPKQVIALDTIPRLGNGKIDYVALAAMPGG